MFYCPICDDDQVSTLHDGYCEDCNDAMDFYARDPRTHEQKMRDEATQRLNERNTPRPLWAQKLHAGQEARNDW